jgi:predicted nucleotide-binding protein
LKPRIFIASSTEGLDLTYALQQNLEHFTAPTVWPHGVFQASSVVLDQLAAAVRTFDFAVFIFSPDDVLRMRGKD